MPQHILITGGAGSIGAPLCERALDAGHRIIVVDDLDPVRDTSQRAQVLERLRGRSGAVVLQGDVRDPQVLADAFGQVPITAIVHLAGRPNAADCDRDPLACHGIHVQGTLAVLEQARKRAVQHVVLGGIPAVLEPAGPLDVSMLAAERFARVHATLHGMRITLVRIPEVYGEGQHPHGLVARVAEAVREGRVPAIGAGPIALVHAARAAEHLLALLSTGGGPGFTVNEGLPVQHWAPADLVEAVRRAGAQGAMPLGSDRTSGVAAE